MELHSLKAAWNQQMQQELGQTKMTLQELASCFQSIDKHLQKSRKENRFWIVIVSIGIGICASGFAFFRLQYTAEKFPFINIALYDSLFVVGMLFLSTTVILMYLYAYRFKRLQSKLFSESLKDSLTGMQKNFRSVELLSFTLGLILLPPLFYLWFNLMSPVFGWSLHQQIWLAITASILATLFCLGIGFLMNRFLFNKEMSKLKNLISDLEGPFV